MQVHLTKLPNCQTANFFHGKELRVTLLGVAELFRIPRDTESAECNGVLKMLRCWPQVSDSTILCLEKGNSFFIPPIVAIKIMAMLL